MAKNTIKKGLVEKMARKVLRKFKAVGLVKAQLKKSSSRPVAVQAGRSRPAKNTAPSASKVRKAEVSSKKASRVIKEGLNVKIGSSGKAKPVASAVISSSASSSTMVLGLASPSVPPVETILTDAEGRPYCKVKDCDQLAAVEGYCRFHYLLLWKRIQVRRKILDDGKLQRYVEELTARYPDKFLEVIRKDLRSEKDFLSAIQELEIDESNLDSDYEEDTESLDEVRSLGGGESGLMDEDSY